MNHRFDPHFWLRPHFPSAASFPSEDAGSPPRTPERRLFGHSAHAPLAGPWADGDWGKIPVPLSPLAERPVGLFIPRNYEEKYAYPLIVWLHGAGGNEYQIASLLPDISDQNYLGLSLRGRRCLDAAAGRFGWRLDEADVDDFLDELYETLCDMRREYHVHSERIFLAGFDEGATLALLSLLKRPEWFGGAIALGGALPRNRRPLSRYRDLQGKRVLMGGGARDQVVGVAEIVRTGRLLNAAGMDVATRIDDAAHELTPAMLRYIDHWVMAGLYAGV